MKRKKKVKGNKENMMIDEFILRKWKRKRINDDRWSERHSYEENDKEKRKKILRIDNNKGIQLKNKSFL